MKASQDRVQVRVGVSLVTAFLLIVLFILSRSAASDAALVVHVSPVNAKVELLEPAGEDQTTRVLKAEAGVARFTALPRGVVAKVKVSAPGFRQAVASQMLPAEGGEITLELNLASETALVTVRTIPDEAMVYLDDKAVGVSPVVMPSVEPGAHRLSARKLGYIPAAQTFTIKPSETRTIELTLLEVKSKSPSEEAKEEEETPPPGFGRVRMKSTHNALFFLDNYKLGYSLNLLRDVTAGPHHVHCRVEGRGSGNRRIEVVEGETTVVEFEFNEDPIDKARRALDPNEPLYWVARGGPTRNSGKYGEAVEMFEHALELDPDYVSAHRQLGFTLAPLKRWDDAIEHLERYIELDEHAPDRDFALEMIKAYEKKRAEEN